MTSRIVITLLVLALVASLGFAAWVYMTKQTTVVTQKDVTATPVTTVTPTTAPSPRVAAASLTDADPLTVANQRAKLEQGTGLLTLSSQYKVSLTTLMRVNGISDANLVQANQTIVIPDSTDETTYTVLFATNTARLQREAAKLTSGSRTIYSDPITAAQNDAKGIAGIANDTPFSQTTTNDNVISLTTTNSERIITVRLQKLESSLWAIDQITIKWLTSEETN